MIEISQYVIDGSGEPASFTDDEALFLRRCGLVKPSDTHPGRLLVTSLVTDDLSLDADQAVVLFRVVTGGEEAD
jgi:hypothetical protein